MSQYFVWTESTKVAAERKGFLFFVPPSRLILAHFYASCLTCFSYIFQAAVFSHTVSCCPLCNIINAYVYRPSLPEHGEEAADALSILANVSETEASVSYLLDLNITNNTHVPDCFSHNSLSWVPTPFHDQRDTDATCSRLTAVDIDTGLWGTL